MPSVVVRVTAYRFLIAIVDDRDEKTLTSVLPGSSGLSALEDFSPWLPQKLPKQLFHLLLLGAVNRHPKTTGIPA